MQRPARQPNEHSVSRPACEALPATTREAHLDELEEGDTGIYEASSWQARLVVPACQGDLGTTLLLLLGDEALELRQAHTC